MSDIAPSGALLERILARTVVDGDCRIWTGSLNPDGYAHLTIGNKQHGAHVIAWEAVNGPTPDGLEIDHLCVRPACVNPAHLEAVTHAENMRRSQNFGGAVNRAKTHCPQGHPYSGANLYTNPSGYRHCRECTRIAKQTYLATARAAGRTVR